MNRSRVFVLILLLSLGGAAAGAGVAGAQVAARLSHDDPALPAAARSLTLGSWMVVESVPLDGLPGPTDLVLERFAVFAPDARIVVRDGAGESLLDPPASAYFRGYLDGEPSSQVLLSVFPDNGMRGLVGSGGRLWVLASGRRARGPAVGLASRRIDIERELDPLAAGWSCAAEGLASPGELLENLLAPDSAADRRPRQAPEVTSYTARIAVETDWEFYNVAGGTTTDVVDYVGDLIAYGSTIYSQEVDTSWLIETVYVYPSPSDPWQQTSSICALYEFGRYWNDNRSHIDRTIAHFMSGKNSGGGVAWLGVLCRGPFTVDTDGSCPGLSPPVDNYGGDYGYSGEMSGDFDIDNPTVVWDMMVVTHEIGHNFNSPHTHDYCGIGGNPEPVDECASACNGGGGTLPPGCSPEEGCGTIMSYCHLLTGGLQNISPTLGLGHPWGNEPERVPAHMLSYVESRAQQYPTCLAPEFPASIFADGFESGDTSAWSTSQP